MNEHAKAEDPEEEITKPTYTIFPKDWDAEQIYEHLMARAEAIEDTENTVEEDSKGEKGQSTEG